MRPGLGSELINQGRRQILSAAARASLSLELRLCFAHAWLRRLRRVILVR
jgi:hypothetical protein